MFEDQLSVISRAAVTGKNTAEFLEYLDGTPLADVNSVMDCINRTLERIDHSNVKRSNFLFVAEDKSLVLVRMLFDGDHYVNAEIVERDNLYVVPRGSGIFPCEASPQVIASLASPLEDQFQVYIPSSLSLISIEFKAILKSNSELN